MRIQADVIAQHTMDKKMIPLKIRIQDEDGEYQTFSVRGYKNLNAIGRVILPNEVPVTSHMRYFQCKINVFNKEKIIDLTYNFNDQSWFVDF